MTTELESAVEFYNKGCLAEEQGKVDLAEIYYLKSRFLFEQAGGAHFLDAANALNALAFLRESRGDTKGALYSAKQSIQVMEKYEAQSADADLIRSVAGELIDNLMLRYELPLQSLIPAAE